MRKTCLLVSLIFGCLYGYSFHKEYISGIESVVVKKAISSSVAPVTNSVSSDRDWVDLDSDDDCMMVDDILTGLFDIDPIEFPVMVQEDANNPGYYRIVNPWLMYPMAKIIGMMGGTLTVSDDIVIEIDATDPDQVIIPLCNIGVDDGDGPVYIGSLLGLLDMVQGLDPIKASAMAGVLEDNCISFTAPTSILMIQGNYAYASNLNGKFALILPGGELPIDYSVELEIENDLCPEDGVYSISVDCDDRIPAIAYGLSTGVRSANVDAIVEAGLTCEPGDCVDIDVSGIDASHIYAIFASLNEDGEWEDYDYRCLYTVGDVIENWKSLGIADMTEGLVSSIYSKDGIEPETFKVEVEEHVEYPGYYRLVDPYKNWSYADTKGSDHAHHHYLYINATDPNCVYFEPSIIGVNDPVHGEYAVKSQYSDRGDYLGFDYLKSRGETSDGVLKDGVITFGADCNIMIHVTEEDPDYWWYGGVHNNPDFDIEQYKTDPNYDVPRFIPGDFKLDLSNLSTKVDYLISAPSSASRKYYNMQGIEIGAPEKGIYLIRENNKVTKKIISK